MKRQQKLEQAEIYTNLYQFYQPRKMPAIVAEKVSKSLDPDKFNVHKKIEVIRSSQKFSPELGHSSFSSPKHNNIYVTIAQNDEAKQAILCYTDMLNQENDLFALYDCFSVFLNSLKQLHQLYQKQTPQQLATQPNEPSRDSLFRLKRNIDDTQWSGVKNLVPEKSRRKEDWLLRESPQVKRVEVTIQKSIKGNASSMIEKLKREVLEMNSNYLCESTTRVIQGKQVQVPIISYDFLVGVLTDQKKLLLQVFQLQNKQYKSQMGFALVARRPEGECRMEKLFIGKYYRKEQYLKNIVSRLIESLNRMRLMKISIKINSGQSELVKAMYESGARLKSEQILVGTIKVFTFMFSGHVEDE